MKSHISPRVCVRERRNLADLCGLPHPPSSSARLVAVVSGESVAEDTLTDPYWPRYPIIGA
ncbi:hypothetical protein DPMN_167348 [Dreissena polymorpha]|uniref:Uncharacterized protein n=1 Tax=Dreissena polymorpha TaxID=45954 RepID=A0A9D4F347_DREPO|nr:hypothetical protein DPMN_167348 [Dreissena polymorpha]